MRSRRPLTYGRTALVGVISSALLVLGLSPRSVDAATTAAAPGAPPAFSNGTAKATAVVSRGLCDRMIALELGTVIAEGTPADVLDHPRVVESYLGTDAAAIARSGARTPAPARH